MLSQEKTDALKSFLSALPESAATRLAAAVEADKRAGGKNLPHDVILDALRHKLAEPELPMPAPMPPRDGLDDLESLVQSIRNFRPADFDEAVLTENLNAFASASAPLLRELGVNSTDRRAQRLAKYRAAVADVMDGFMERAPRAIAQALPVHKLGAFGFRNPRRLDLSKPPDTERLAQAKRFATLLVACRPIALGLGFDASLAPALEDVTRALRRYGEDIAREVRVSQPETRERAEAHLAAALELCATVLGKEEAELLRRQSLSS